MDIRKLILVVAGLLVAAIVAAEPMVTDVTAKQRYPWNGLVDISCKVTGINGTTNGLKFAVSAVMPDSGDIRSVSRFWVMQNGTNSTDRKVHTNGNYRLLWDAQTELDSKIYSNMVVRIAVIDLHDKVQLWDGGPFWATTNIGASEPWEYGYYFWWGDTVGYKWEGGLWVGDNGTSFSYFSSNNAPAYGKKISVLASEGWITSNNVLVPEHDAAYVHWGGSWRMPTDLELSNLVNRCDWIWTNTNGVSGFVVCGRGSHAHDSIFLPASGSTGDSLATSLHDVNCIGQYWSSVPSDNMYMSWSVYFGYTVNPDVNNAEMRRDSRYRGHTVRPVQ